jgi:hypothetical protein
VKLDNVALSDDEVVAAIAPHLAAARPHAA